MRNLKFFKRSNQSKSNSDLRLISHCSYSAPTANRQSDMRTHADILLESVGKSNVILNGGPGSGKSFTLFKTLDELLPSDKNLRICPICPNSYHDSDIEKFKSLIESYPIFPLDIAYDNSQITSLLTSLRDEMESRISFQEKRGASTNFTKLVIIFDEFSQSCLNDDIMSTLSDLADRGPQVNITLILISQSLSSDSFPAYLKDYFDLTLHFNSAPKSLIGHPIVLSSETISSNSWLNFKSLKYDNGVNWQLVERTTHQASKSEVVMVVPIDREARKVLVTKEFRYTIGSEVIDFPTGLIDGNESIEEAALRELKEETGYTGSIYDVLPPSYSSIGMTNESLSVVFVDVDSSKAVPTQNLDESEIISCKWMSFEDAKSLSKSSISISGRAQLIMFSL